MNLSVQLFSRVDGWHGTSVSSSELFGLCVSGFCPVRSSWGCSQPQSLSLPWELSQGSLPSQRVVPGILPLSPFYLFFSFGQAEGSCECCPVRCGGEPGAARGVFTAALLQEQRQAVKSGCKHSFKPENWISPWPDGCTSLCIHSPNKLIPHLPGPAPPLIACVDGRSLLIPQR